MTITVVFDPPLPSDSPATFNAKAFSTLGDLNDWSAQANALPAEAAAAASAAGAASATAAANAVLASKANLSGADFTGPVTSGTAKSITDWNAITSSGYYMGAGATGAPDANWYMGYTIVHNELWMTQEIWAFTNNTDTDHLRYRREKNNGTWTSWVRVYGTPEEITSFAASLNGATFLGNIVVGASAGTGEAKIELGQGRTGNGVTYIDLIARAGADYNSRILRAVEVDGNLNIENTGNGSIVFIGNSDPRLVIQQADGLVAAYNSVGIGYGTGSGGAVTQATSKSTSVTLNKPSGQITMHNAALAAGDTVYFQVNNSVVSANDGVILQNAFNANYEAMCFFTNSGAFGVRIKNITGGSLSENCILYFNVIKGSTT